MATHESKDGSQQEQIALQDSQITTTKVDRRSFLARAVGASTLVVGAVVTSACGDEADNCDSDVGDLGENIDSGSTADSGDSCDSDM